MARAAIMLYWLKWLKWLAFHALYISDVVKRPVQGGGAFSGGRFWLVTVPA